jgi:trans-aconitate 2-methyltransferase
MSDRVSGAACKDWNPGTYERFRDLRLRPARDLLAQVPDLPPGAVVDLGCGAGAVGPALKARFPRARLVGLDSSEAMLARAEVAGVFDTLLRRDIDAWQPDEPVALIFSNAALHWLGDHDRLLPRLAGYLAPGGVLAVQMPGNFNAPSHALLREIAARRFPDRFSSEEYLAPVRPARGYAAMLAPLGHVDGWETEYVQRLDPVSHGHPVRAFTESTAMRPFLARLTDGEAEAFIRDYDAALEAAYPRAADGTVLFPFRRVFFVLARP